MENIQFEYMRAEIQPKCADKIAKLAAWMKENPKASVRAALVAAGVAPSRISDGAFGARQPVCAEATANCLALNRRVEVLSAGLMRQA